jgi:ribosomal protein S18 acetylase RimI-like enzyme
VAKRPTRAERLAARLEAMTPEEHKTALALLSGHAWRWQQTVLLQQQRVRDADFGASQQEMQLFALALRSLLRCVQMATALGVPVDDLLTEFDEVAPQAKQVRDVLEHFDDYELGIGDVQDVHGRPEFRGFMYGRSGDGKDAHLLVLGLNLELQIDEAADLARRLVDELLERLQPDRAPG